MNALNKINTIAYYTMKEVLKSKILLNVFLIGLGMMLVTFVASEFTYGVPGKVALDFGLGMLWFSSCGISLFMGVTLIAKEIDSRTVYMIISRPVPRYAFVLGKVLGLVSVLIINIFLLAVMTLITTLLLGGQVDELVYWSVGFTLIESILLLLVVIFFSLNVNSIITVLISVILLMSGHAIQETQGIKFVLDRPFLKSALEIYHLVLPGFYKLNLKDYILYHQSLPLSYLVPNLFYGLSYSVFVLLLIIIIFNKKNID